MSEATIAVVNVKNQVSPEEWQVRQDLAAAYRLVAHYGWDDMVFTHLSARVPGPQEHFLLNPYGFQFSEVTASNLVKVMRKRNNSITGTFGVTGTKRMLAAFSKMDTAGSGEVTLDQFIEKADYAFSHPEEFAAAAHKPTTKEALYLSIFHDLDAAKKGYFTARDLVRHLKKKPNRISEAFGGVSKDRAFELFNKLDTHSEGQVSLQQFKLNAEAAFTQNALAPVPRAVLQMTPIFNSTPAPVPPPLTREMLYRSVFDEMDSDKSGFITQQKLVKAMRNRRSSVSQIFG